MSIPHKAFLAMLAEKQQILRDNHLIDTTETMRADIQEASCGNMKIDEPLKGKGYPYNEKTFKPHMMYDPKTGKGYKANTYQDHLDMKKKGYGHEKPEVKEAVRKKVAPKRKPIKGNSMWADAGVTPKSKGWKQGTAAIGISSYTHRGSEDRFTKGEKIFYHKYDIPKTGGGSYKKYIFAKDPKDPGSYFMGDTNRVNESVEQVDELKVKTMKSYISKAQKDNTKRVTRMADKPSHMKADKGEMQKLRKRQKGVVKAKTDLDMRKIAGKDYRKRMGEDVEQVDEATRHTVHVETNRAGYRKLEKLIASLDGYQESEFEKEGKATFRFDAKKHDGTERKKVAEFIKKTAGVEFSHAIKEDNELAEGPATQNPLKTAFGGLKAAKDTPSYKAYMKRVEKEQKARAKKIAAERKAGKRSKYESVDNPEYDPELGDMNIGEERIEEMSAKAHYKSVLKGGKGKGYVVGVAIDRNRYPNREKEGLEGPYKSRKSGKIFYYDKKEGKYYDPDSDMFLAVSDVMERYESADVARERDEKELKESFQFQFADKETAQEFMREISQKRLGSSTGTKDGKVRTEGPAGAGVGSPTRAHQQMAKIMKKHGGKLISTDEGPRMKKVFKEDVSYEGKKPYFDMSKKRKFNVPDKRTRLKDTGKNPAKKPYPKQVGEEIDMINEDDVERREIELFTSNHAQIYRQRIQPIIKNLAKKKAKGNYDDKLAIKAWTYAVNDGIKAYNKEFGSSIKLSKAEKDKAAEYLLKHFEDE